MVYSTLLSWLAIGLTVGGVSKLLFSGQDSGSWTATLLISVTGAVLDGWGGVQVLGQRQEMTNWMASMVGAVVLLVVYRFVLRRNLML